MSVINLLPKSVSELIAAGEVVERPASVVKETVENSIDAKAKHITVEIKQGGVTFIRITDDGCGIAAEDVPTAFLRHATSKIKSADDLGAIGTLGFRGEALAAISSVSLTEIITKTDAESCGTHYIIEGGTEQLSEEVGCPTGTTLIIRNLFYNTPARMKFLKKDSTEATAVGAVLERMALSHPEIAFKYIKDEKQVFSTSGDGKLLNTVYTVLGRDFHSSLIAVEGETDGVKVSGYTCKPIYCKASRASQFTFLNGRLVLSKTVMAAVEQAYKDSRMVGKFPGFVIFVNVPADCVDVNVHPAKTEVRFSDEKRIFRAVFYAVKSAITTLDTRPEMPIKSRENTFFKMNTQQYRQSAVWLENLPKNENNGTSAENPIAKTPSISALKQDNVPFFLREDVRAFKENQARKAEENAEQKSSIDIDDVIDEAPQNSYFEDKSVSNPPKPEPTAENTAEKAEEYDPENEVKLVGEAFSTYIIAEQGDSIYIIDKHAAHERIIYNQIKNTEEPQAQGLLCPVTVHLALDEYEATIKNLELLYKAGFEAEDFGNGDVIVRSIPAALDKLDVAECFAEAVSTLKGGTAVNTEALDAVYHTVACKAAIKGGYITSNEELLSLAKRVLSDRSVMYCPHGRPVAYAIKKRELDKYFGRIQ